MDLRRVRCFLASGALAEEYGVALGTMRHALADLRSRGLVETLPAKGTYVLARE